MSTNNDNNDTTITSEGSTSTETQPSTVATPRVFSQEEVNRIAASAREDGRKSALKTPSSGQPPPAAAAPAPVPPPAPTVTGNDESERVTLKQLKERLDESEMRREFDKRASKRGIDDTVSEELFEIYKAQKPSNADEWFEKKSLLFGLKPAGTPAAPTAATAPVPQQPVPTPAAAPTAPNGATNPVSVGGIVDIFNLSHAQLMQMGSAGVRAELDKARAHHHQSSGLARLPRAPERK